MEIPSKISNRGMNVLKLEENKKAPNNRCRPLKAKKSFYPLAPLDLFPILNAGLFFLRETS